MMAGRKKIGKIIKPNLRLWTQISRNIYNPVKQDDTIYIYIISIKMAKTVAGKISGVLNWK